MRFPLALVAGQIFLAGVIAEWLMLSPSPSNRLLVAYGLCDTIPFSDIAVRKFFMLAQPGF